MSQHRHHARLRAGDRVEVRSKAEILSTLDPHGRLEGLPFMPEMFRYCGQQFEVWKRAHKTCDTVHQTGGRRMPRTVHLKDLRCDGSAHGGCQADCLLFWKEAWLKPVPPAGRTAAPVSSAAPSTIPGGCQEEDVVAGTLASLQDDPDNPTFACQATELPAATQLLKWWDVRQYVEDYFSGNASLGRIARGFLFSAYRRLINLGIGLGPTLRWLYDAVQQRRNGVPYPLRRGPIARGQKTPVGVLGLQPGEWVRVKSLEEILKTLDVSNKNRGLYYDAEVVPFCGRLFRVKKRVNAIIDEKTGKMLKFKNESVILEGACCEARYSEKRLFCPRAIYPMWREIWLERIPDNRPESARSPRDSSSNNPSSL